MYPCLNNELIITLFENNFNQIYSTKMIKIQLLFYLFIVFLYM